MAPGPSNVTSGSMAPGQRGTMPATATDASSSSAGSSWPASRRQVAAGWEDPSQQDDWGQLGMWEQHLKQVLKKMGGEEIAEFAGNFWFPTTRLMLSTYVDDLTLAGPRDQHEKFWSEITSVVNVEPPEPIYRILGRNLTRWSSICKTTHSKPLICTNQWPV